VVRVLPILIRMSASGVRQITGGPGSVFRVYLEWPLDLRLLFPVSGQSRTLRVALLVSSKCGLTRGIKLSMGKFL
jgi:hypothetical protein